MAAIRMAVVGVGKIVRDQHAPVMAASPDFELVATSSPHSTLDGVPAFKSLDELFDHGPQVDAVTVSTTPQVRHANARQALAAGKHVLLEKPPGATLSELEDLRDLARDKGLTLFASWHSRFAPQVEAARAWLADHAPDKVSVAWREDVRRWHPGQDWVFDPGGLGVFDPGVNALSILTRIAPQPVFLKSAELDVPAGRQTPIAARLQLTDPTDAEITAEFDWRETGEQRWEIEAQARDGGRMRLFEGGAKLEIDGEPAPDPDVDAEHAEYLGVYARFAELVRARESETDDRPLRLAADAFLLGRRTEVERFDL